MDGDGDTGIVWMIDGREIPCEAAGESRRPGREESSAWGEPDAPAELPEDGEKDDDAEPPELLWV